MKITTVNLSYLKDYRVDSVKGNIDNGISLETADNVRNEPEIFYVENI